jgi:hypothetical protein
MCLSGPMTGYRGAALAACIVALTAIWAASATAQRGPRTDIWTYQYGGVDISDRHNKAFSAFKSMLRGRMLTLAGELTALAGELAYLNGLDHLDVKDRDGRLVEFKGNPNKLKERWNNEGTLALIHGMIRERTARFRVRSQFYYGDFHGELDTSDLRLETEFSLEDFELASESHTAATIYAIAMEAEARGVSDPTVLALLNKAKSYALGIDDAEGIAPLSEAIEKSLARLTGGGP